MYFIHHVLLNWPDKECLDILANVRSAMTSSYSKLLIYDLVLPDHHASTMQCVHDLAMMTINGGKTRSRSQWTELLKKAGLEVVKIWIDDEDADGIIEVERK